MNGRGVYTFVAKILPHYVENLVEKSGMKADDIDYLIPHQANIRIIQAVQERLGYPDEKLLQISNIMVTHQLLLFQSLWQKALKKEKLNLELLQFFADLVPV